MTGSGQYCSTEHTSCSVTRGGDVTILGGGGGGGVKIK